MARSTRGIRTPAVPFHVRQGDVLVVAVSAIPAGVVPRAREGGKVILAHGEVTGHSHCIADTVDAPAAAIYDDPAATDGSFYLRVETPAGLVHDEHARIDLPAGDYRVIRQRQYQPAGIISVLD